MKVSELIAKLLEFNQDDDIELQVECEFNDKTYWVSSRNITFHTFIGEVQIEGNLESK